MRGIDAHAHLQGGRIDPAALAQGNRLGIELFFCSNIGDFVTNPSPGQIRDLNAELGVELSRHPEHLRGYCYVNPHHGQDGLSDVRRNIEERGMIGLKLWLATVADDPLVDPYLEYAAEHRLIVLTHAWRKSAGQLPNESTARHVARAARRHPNTRFLMAHLGGQVESALDAVRDEPNIAVDTSGSIIGRGDVALAIERLGSDRVVFGSDLHHVDLAANVGKVLGANLDATTEQQVFGGTVAKWLSEVAP